MAKNSITFLFRNYLAVYLGSIGIVMSLGGIAGFVTSKHMRLFGLVPLAIGLLFLAAAVKKYKMANHGKS